MQLCFICNFRLRCLFVKEHRWGAKKTALLIFF